MIQLFISLRVLDLIDIFLLAFLMYQIYLLIKGTVAFNIFVGLFAFYVLWFIVKSLNMQLLGSILGQFIGVGVIALIVVFQQEIRRFLLIIGTRYFSQGKFSLDKFFAFKASELDMKIQSIVLACENLAKTKTGALIVISKKSGLITYAESGDILNADTSNRLLESIFLKNSPLHDGAVIIDRNKIYAARCILPTSEKINLPAHYGMRHRAALGITELTDAVVIVISEETGEISLAKEGKIKGGLGPQKLENTLNREFKKPSNP